VQGTTNVPVAPFSVEVPGDPPGVGVDLDDGVQPRAATVDRLDPVEVLVDELSGRPGRPPASDPTSTGWTAGDEQDVDGVALGGGPDHLT
jgi:hypothetical protein